MKELEKERVNFIYGNEELGIDGAIKRGVPEAVAASLFDEIMDFANYAFNKAHAGLATRSCRSARRTSSAITRENIWRRC